MTPQFPPNRSEHRRFLVIAAAALGPLLGASGDVGASAVPQSECRYYCGSAELGCVVDYHKNIQFEPKNASEAAHTNCLGPISCSEVLACIPDPGGSVEAVANAIERRDARRLLKMISASPHVVLSKHRGAIQVLDCAGSVVAHLKIEPRLMLALEFAAE